MFSITEALSYLFPGGRALKLIQNDVRITNSSNVLMLTKNVTLTVIDCCTPPPVRLGAHCIGDVSVLAASIVSPNTVTIGTAIHLITELNEECYSVM